MKISADMDHAIISRAEVERLLALQEGHFLDFKSIEIQPSKLLRTVSAFANADGGELYIGVYAPSNGGANTWKGFQSPEEANGHIQAIEQVLPLGNYYRGEFLYGDGAHGVVLHLDIRKSREIVKTANAEVYVRG